MTASKKLILLAEDDPDQRELLAEILELEGYRVIHASEPKEVLEGLLRGPKLVLLDLVGVASPQVIKAIGHHSPRPALLLVSADPGLAAAAAHLGATGYLSKPYELDELLARVAEALGERPQRAALDEAWVNA